MSRRSSEWHARNWHKQHGVKRPLIKPKIEEPETYRHHDTSCTVTVSSSYDLYRHGRIRRRYVETTGGTGGTEVMVDEHGCRWTQSPLFQSCDSMTGQTIGFIRDDSIYVY